MQGGFIRIVCSCLRFVGFNLLVALALDILFFLSPSPLFFLWAWIIFRPGGQPNFGILPNLTVVRGVIIYFILVKHILLVHTSYPMSSKVICTLMLHTLRYVTSFLLTAVKYFVLKEAVSWKLFLSSESTWVPGPFLNHLANCWIFCKIIRVLSSNFFVWAIRYLIVKL